MIRSHARLPLSAWALCVLGTAPVVAGTRPEVPVTVQDADLAERLFRSGERAHAARSYKEALDTWAQLLQSAPKSDQAAQALLALARHQLSVEGKPEAALPHLDRIKAEHMKSSVAAEALVLRGEILAQLARRAGDLKDAVAEFNRVLDLFPDHPAASDALLGLGRAARDQAQWGSALSRIMEAYRVAPEGPQAASALLESAELMDQMGDLPGCLRQLQKVRTLWPQSPQASEAAWRLAVRIRHRIQKPAFRFQGVWPANRAKWLKTPTLLTLSPTGEVLVYQNEVDRVTVIRNGEAVPVGPLAPSVKAMVAGPKDSLFLLSTKSGLIREAGVLPLPALGSPTGAFLDRWGSLWISDAKLPGLTLISPDGASRTLPTPAAVALAPHPSGGALLAADGNRALILVGPEGQTLLNIPYGKDLPTAFRNVVALATDGAGQTAALVEGGDFGEGVVVFGPDGAVLRSATFKSLGVSGRITSLALDREGGILLCDRRNDTLLRLF